MVFSRIPDKDDIAKPYIELYITSCCEIREELGTHYDELKKISNEREEGSLELDEVSYSLISVIDVFLLRHSNWSF